jgi:tetratricopeptide (TPR) repeat protein
MMLFLSGCEKFALMTTAKKQPMPSHSRLAIQAENQFWTSLHQGNYQNIPTVTKLLTAAYLENPNDPQLAAHLGFTHIWKLAERAHQQPVQPTIVDEIILAKKYFADAVELNSNDARYLGFLGDSILIEGKTFHDERQQVHGYFVLKKAIHMWPEFNYFTAGYPMSTLDPHSKQYQEALDWQWKTLDLCAGEVVNRNNPDFTPYLHRDTQTGPQRACWNSWIAPHNFEGFFLNMGDMLVKKGEWQTAIKIYHNAKLSKQYASWPFHEMLEHRIQQAQENVKNFQTDEYLSADTTILFNSGHGCMVCHQGVKK